MQGRQESVIPAKLCVDENIPVIPIPGPCAVVAALSASGLDTDEFTFVGFLSKHGPSRRERLTASANEARTQIFYVPPHKFSQFLEESSLLFGDSRYIRLIIFVASTAHEVYKAHHRSTALPAFSQFYMDMQVLTSSQGNSKKKMYWLYVAGIPVRRALFRLSRFLRATLSLCDFIPLDAVVQVIETTPCYEFTS